LGDYLQYRIPGEPIVSLNGNFMRVEDRSNVKGFIVADFDQKNLFQFVEDIVKQEIHFSSNFPVVLERLEYLKYAREFLQSFQKKRIQKAVFSRILSVEVDPSQLLSYFEQLCEVYPEAFVYLISSKEFGTWIGATPEKLLSTTSGSGQTVSLAGTKRSDDLTPWDEKEIQEQRYVTDFILNKLNSEGIKNIVCSEVYESVAGPVKHLKNDIRFSIDADQVMHLATILHPTPAVSGVPQEKAIELIHNVEPHERGLYTGFIGFRDTDRSQLYVNLRCCQIIENNAFLYLGGGFTVDSNIEKEWEETENKSKTLLNILLK
jgi:isochorismate synthase